MVAGKNQTGRQGPSRDVALVNQDLVIRRFKAGCSVHLELDGELDFYSADVLDRWLRKDEQDGCAELVVDLSGLSFVDSNGLAILVQGARRAGVGGWTFRVVNTQGTVRKIFEITQMDSVINYWGGSRNGRT